MIFDSGQFALFLAAAVFLIRLPYKRPADFVPGLLLFVSAVFYAFAGPWAWLLFFVSIIANHRMAGLMQGSAGATRRRWLGLAIVFNLFYLFSFKYIGLAGAILSTVGSHLGWWTGPLPVVRVLLPIGISFYTFEAISVLVDVYHERYALPPLKTYALFLGYFPHLVAGPIVRGNALLPQLRELSVRVPQADGPRALAFLSVGLFKKAVLADSLALLVDPLFAHPGAYAGPKLAIGAYAFALRIFFDFSGYSDMAEGASALFGIRLTRNFDRPYGAASLSEFWRRWHVSLSTWLRDYLFIPLGGSRQGMARTVAALLVTMALGGLWHGAKATFFVWGCYHGVLLSVERIFGWNRPPGRGWRRALRVLLTFHLVLLGWVVFRADTFGAATVYLGALLRQAWLFDANTLGLCALLALGALFLLWEGAWADRAWNDNAPAVGPTGLALMHAAIIVMRLGQSHAAQPFIYYRF